MRRKTIQIDQEKCNGCQACALACHEGAIAMIDGKAQLVRDDYCDGLGDCLPVCPTQAISFVESDVSVPDKAARATESAPGSCLTQWPVQIKLAPLTAPYFDGADLLIAADCAAFSYGDFHRRFIAGRVVLIGCPKLDSVDYSEKLAQIFTLNNIASITIARMEVPCCGGLEFAVQKALSCAGKSVSCQVVTISTKGEIL